MIKQVDITEILSEENLFTVKIKSNFDCYNKFDFCNTFFQSINGENTAFINILNGNFIVFALENADFEEIEKFLYFYSAKSIFCNQTVAKHFGISRFKSGIILKITVSESTVEKISYISEPNYKALYNLLKNEFSLPDYNNFVSDLSFRLKNGFAKVIQTDKGAIFSAWETGKSTVISALAVDITERRKGEGAKLLNLFINSNNKNTVYVYCEKEKAQFYQKNGFSTDDTFYFSKGFLK